MLLSFCAKKVTKEGALRGELRFSPRLPPCKRPKRSTSLESPFRASTYELASQRGSLWVKLCVIVYSDNVCKNDIIFLQIVVLF